MSDYPNEIVQDAANKLMNALALHEDARGTLTDALHDMWDAGREHATTQRDQAAWWCLTHGRDACEDDPEPSCRVCDFATTLRAIRSDARALRDGTALTRTVPAGRIIDRVNQLLTALGHSDGQSETPSADPDLLKFLDAAIIRALDISLDTADPAQRAQIGDWVAKARDAKNTRDAAAIRALLREPYLRDGGR